MGRKVITISREVSRIEAAAPSVYGVLDGARR